jgi:hypothetical protein
MTDSLEQRVTGLEELVKPLVPLPGRVKELETCAGPGQNEALSKNIAEFRTETNGHFTEVKKKLKELGAVQDQQTGLLHRHARMLDDALLFICRTRDDLKEFRIGVSDFKTEVTAETTGLKSDVGTLKGDVSALKGDVGTLKGDVSALKGDVSTLKGDVSTLKGDVSTLKGDMVEVKGALAEILDRLPAKGA